jgi:hypothetical protein
VPREETGATAAAARTLSILVGEARLLWFIARVGVYLTDRVDELESEPALKRRVATGILERGVCRWGDRARVCSCACACVRGVGCASSAKADVAVLADRPWCELLLNGVEACAASACVLSKTGMPKPGDSTSCPVSTSPKSCLPLGADARLGEVTFLGVDNDVDEMCWSMLLLLPFVLRAFRGDAGAGCGRSRGFRLLNLCGPYEASLLGRAADAVDEMDAFARLAESCAPVPARLGVLDLERTAGEDVVELAPGDCSNRSASARTLAETWGEERVAAGGDAGPEADLGVALGVVRAPFVMGCRCRPAGMSMPRCGEGGVVCSVVV